MSSARAGRRADRYRRLFDVSVSSVLALMTLPVMLAALLGSAISLRAWPIFTQERIGRDGQIFRFVKVRTLPPATPSYAGKHELDTAATTPFCRFLRRLHLDELPQLYLVVIGRMSLVGPRPEMSVLHDAMTPDFAVERTEVRPGCTGLWQVSTASAGLIGAAPAYDRLYLQHRSLRFDSWILYRTFLKMTALAPPITLADVPQWAVVVQHEVEGPALAVSASR